jgi:Spondin_N
VVGTKSGLLWMVLVGLVGCSEVGTPASPSPLGAGVDSAPPGTLSDSAPPTARYRVTFQSTWTRESHPEDFPGGAHFSALVGATHSGAVRFWVEGGLATPGMRDMAERGRTTPLDREIQAAIGQGTAERVLIGAGLGTAPASTTIEFEVGRSFPLVTLVSMIAPSPDWFVGVSGLSLAESGRWVSERRVDLVPWDAGTDGGRTFTSADEVTSPPAGITRILTAPLSPAGRVTPLGTFTFTLVP